jgi:hypothetical protein
MCGPRALRGQLDDNYKRSVSRSLGNALLLGEEPHKRTTMN